MAGRPPDTMRMYSWFVDDRGILKLNKGNKPQMREWLRAPKVGPWFAAIADSGQKHVIPWTPVNPAGSRGRVMLEETTIALPSDWALLDDMAALLTAGATKEEVGRGEYGQGSWERCADAIRMFEARHGSMRHGGWFALALWLAQRDEDAVAKRMDEEKAAREAKKETRKRDRREDKRATPDVHRGGAARDSSGLPVDVARERVEALGTDPRSDAGGIAHDDGTGGVGDRDGARASATGTQCSLFDDAPRTDARRARGRVRK
jgi:hypothetical protein